MDSNEVHAVEHRSWWDGTVTAYCGLRYEAAQIRENWFRGGITCPECKTAAGR